MNNDELLDYYQQELTYIKRLGAEFAAAHPKVAGRLGINGNVVEDPHVARLIEAFALANARIRYKLDDEFPEISDALLNILHPHYLAPIPAMSLVQFEANEEKLLSRKIIPADTMLVTDNRYGEPCYFTTRYAVELLPIKIKQAFIKAKPLLAPVIPAMPNATSVLCISLSCNQDKLLFNQLEINELKFFINAQAQHAYAFYELLFNHTIAIAIANSQTDKNPLILDKNCLQTVGFAEEEGLLPYSKRTFMGHRLLTEFFNLPEKFLFFKLTGLLKYIQQKNIPSGECLEIYFYLNQVNSVLEKNLNAQFFVLGCTPVVNLFSSIAEPFNLTHTQSEYHLVANMKKSPQATEIYAVKRVLATNDEGAEIEYQPFYGLKHYQNAQYYHSNRRPAWQDANNLNQGTEIFLSFTDLNFNPIMNEKWVVSADILCTNRDLPSQLPFGGDEPYLHLLELKTDVIKKIKCVVPITPCKRPFLSEGARWRYISHLSLNHLSLTNDEEGIAALCSLLKIYAGDNGEHNNLLEGLLAVQAQPVTARNPNSYRGNIFWQGTKINLRIDETKFSGTSIYLFGCILEHFFALYTTINSFTELVLTSPQRGEIYRWLPRTGDKALL
jgi:type VI secretion system protein ImpG